MCRCVVALYVGLFFIIKNLIKQDLLMLKQRSVTVENEIQIFENVEFSKVRTMVINDEPLFVGKDVAEALGYSDTSSAVSKNVDADEKTTLLLEQDGSNYKSKTTLINESGLYSLILSSKLPTAKKFRKWVTSEVLPSIRKTGQYSATKSISPTTEEAVLWITFVGKELGLNDSSKLLLMKQWGERKGLPTPDYVSSKDVLLSASELLKRNNVSVSARVFNVAMIEKGFLEKCTRPSSKGQKVFNHLTTKGLAYGENQVSPSNPKETQPLYYENKFSQLLTEVGLR